MQIPQPSPELIAEGFSARVVMPEGERSRPLIVGEAPGKTEDETGIPFHPEAEAGGLFARLMARVGVERERFSITNCVWQRPPGNELYDDEGNPRSYTREAIDYWRPFLHQAIEELEPPVIIGLGRTALETLTGFSDIGTTRGYVNLARIVTRDELDDDWNVQYEKVDLNIPTICTYHPQFLNYGNRYLSGVFIRDVLEGLEIAQKGWHPPKLKVVPNPTVEQFKWFCAQYNPERHILTYDIENPETRGVGEDEIENELGKKEISYEIDRMSLCFDTNIGGWSVPFAEPFVGLAKSLLVSAGTKRGHNCMEANTPILTADLRWIPARSLKVGDKLLGFEEHVRGSRKRRRIQTSTVQHSETVREQAIRLTLSDGTELICTPEHPWLLPTNSRAKKYRSAQWHWLKTCELRIGQSMPRALGVWATDESREGGYLAGFFDGEGCLTYEPLGEDGCKFEVSAAQNVGITLDYVLQILTKLGYPYRLTENARNNPKSKVIRFRIGGRHIDLMRFLGAIRPIRLLSKFDPTRAGTLRYPSESRDLHIVKIEECGYQTIQRLTTSTSTYFAKGFAAHNCRLHDRPRLERNGFSVRGREEDTLELWRHLHRTLPASVAYIAPFYLSISPWKHEAHTQPEWYSAMDAICQHLIGEGIERDLRASGQWEMAQRHVVDVLALTERMSQSGLPYDSVKAKEFELELEGKQKERLDKLQVLVPDHIKPVKQKEGYKKVPKDTSGLIQREFLLWQDGLPVRVTRWAKLLPFNPDSWQQKLKLIHHFGHKPKTDRKTRKPTTGDATMRALVAQCLKSGKDETALECYKLIRECVAIATALGFVRGWKPGSDGCLHATPGLWGDMFRLSWRKPPLSATPADKKEIQIAAGFRKCICVPDDQVIIEADWQSQEAVILGWYAKDESYIRLARLSLNAYMTSHLLGRPAELSWSDADLHGYLREIKDDKRNVKLYDDAKHTIYLIQNGGTPYLISEAYDMSLERATYLYKFYFDLFPAIARLHKRILQEAHEHTKLVNPWGYRMPVWEAYTWNQKRYDRLRKLWVKYQTTPNAQFNQRDNDDLGRIELQGSDDQAIRSLCYDLGTEAKAALSFYPRDTGSAMLKDALLAMENEHQLVSRGILRATAHDSVISITGRRELDDVAQAMKDIMERPQPPLDGLVVGVDVAIGQSWDKKALVGWKPQLVEVSV